MEELKCPYCNGHNFRKSGHSKTGKQRYYCKECKRWFSEDTVIREEINKTCVHCGSINVRLNGICNEHQVYLCKDCNRGFSDVTVILPAIEDKCPYCGGELAYKGWNKSGTRRYRCKDCGKSCSSKTVKEIPLREDLPPCPHCHSKNTKMGGVLRSGEKRYYCKDCGKSYSKNTVIREEVTLKCPICNGQVYRCGLDRRNNQRYLCKECNYKFIENANSSYINNIAEDRMNITDGKILHNRKLTSEQKQLVLNKIMNGGIIEKLTKQYNVPNNYFSTELTQLYRKEHISPKQYQDICKFGVHCSVPVEWIAPYIPCSIHKCNTVMKEYKQKLGITETKKSKYKLTDKDIAADNLMLERFHL